MDKPLTLLLYPEPLAICQLPAGSAVPDWITRSEFYAVTRTPEELSLVCATACLPPGVPFEGPWRAFQVEGPLDFSLTGILAGLSTCLAAAQISLFAISTYNTDYVLVRAGSLVAAQNALLAGGYQLA